MELFCEHYNAFEDVYEIDSPTGQERLKYWTEFVSEHVKLPPKSLVSDAGCGKGITTLALFKAGISKVSDSRQSASLARRKLARKARFFEE